MSGELWASVEGLPFPLGATWIGPEQAWNFAVYSEHAEQVTLLLYAEPDLATPVVVHDLHYLRNKSGNVWHCRIPAAAMKGATSAGMAWGQRPIFRRLRAASPSVCAERPRATTTST